ncbi:sensor histidine kinase [Paenibacillus thailandensis]|uniref:Sensor histidine kinase n=1 Tax=Paenibacillus thailandensis TaxID=393250 RepID=A0ABW5QWI1_9BACL
MQTKLFLTFFPLLLVILGCFLIYVHGYVISPLREKTIDETRMTATQLSDQLEDYIDVQNQLSQRVLSNHKLFESLNFDSGSLLEGLQRARLLRDIMFQALGPSMDVRDMAVYSLEGRPVASYFGVEIPGSIEPVLKDERYADKLRDSSFILHAEKPGSLAFVRSIIDVNGKVYGYLYIQLDYAYFQKAADGVTASGVYVIDSDGKPIVTSQGTNGRMLDEPSMRDLADSGIYSDDSGNFVAYQKSESSGWTTVVVKSKSAVLGSVNSVSGLSILLIVGLTLFSAVYVYFFARNIVLPVRRLRSQIMRMNYSNLNLRIDSRLQNNDLVLLNEAFGELLERLQSSIEREKLAVHEEAMARNTALQAQIAPHFIHNALYLISIAAQEGNNEAVSDMCKQLSESLRYIVSSPYKHVNMLEEIEHTKRYLSLVERNYEEDLDWEIETDPSAEAIQLPRLVIQPFVENCIEHAFENTDPPWKIHIRIKLFNGLWAMEISDNGKGIDPDKIKEIVTKIEESDHGAQELKSSSLGIGSMGMINTVNRLKLMYKNRLFFNVFNNPDNSGTTVQIIASLKRDFY